ncbi:MAG TPA: UDP-3-O-[3-hydroxymyristoyl] N-acetylglucosamine deacetylase [Rhodospirillaceae bacterium]|nr:MAG: UDP-3-O-[3-hydroxymyristoyl] N-acetylglucosamine deacetylase [Alphaproteobacteria bacterium GWF2_58_20]HAU30009.1 UDP-3-O-[3-hydroxymyristoyl] N-acetylglucosamine deacetylase [Rhodospirillaceae bacterium]
MQQHTLKSWITCSGIALHSGARVSMTLHPAEPNTGVVFVRTDISGRDNVIPARYDHVVDTRLCTVIGNGDGVTVATIEHLMAALSTSEIDNARIEIDGPEVPIMDGSAEPFLFLIECTGTVPQKATRKAIKILKSVTVGNAEKTASLSPSVESGFSFEIEFPNPAIGRQSQSVRRDTGALRAEISRARTFGFLSDIEKLRKMGLARGGTMDNAIVLSDEGVMNEDGLRFPDEFVRHKILDSVGDIYLAGYPIIGHYHGWKSGHALNNELVRTLFSRPDAWHLVDCPKVSTPLAACA